jgi:hypothetical protein
MLNPAEVLAINPLIRLNFIGIPYIPFDELIWFLLFGYSRVSDAVGVLHD